MKSRAGAFRPGLVVPAHYEMFAKNSEDPLLDKRHPKGHWDAFFY
jgi:hypothetical protein